MTQPQSLSPGPEVADFRRLGIRPNEIRLSVIRSAAVRSTSALAKRQLDAPSPQGSLQLSQLTTSIYRLLDPRQRSDAQHRAFVGRMFPHGVDWAGQTDFVSDSSEPTVIRIPFKADSSEQTEWFEIYDLDSREPKVDLLWLNSLSDGHLLGTSPLRRKLRRVRRRVFHPLVLVALIGMTIGTWLGVSSLHARLKRAQSPAVSPISQGEPAPPPLQSVAEMHGRLRLADAQRWEDTTDIGVAIDYQLDVALDQPMLDSIAKRLQRDVPGVMIRVVGDVILDQPDTVRVSLQTTDARTAHTVTIDDQAVPLDILDNSLELSLSSGRHRVVWTITTERLASPAALGIHDAQSGQRVPMQAITQGNAAAQPIGDVTVSMTRREG